MQLVMDTRKAKAEAAKLEALMAKFEALEKDVMMGYVVCACFVLSLGNVLTFAAAAGAAAAVLPPPCCSAAAAQVVLCVVLFRLQFSKSAAAFI